MPLVSWIVGWNKESMKPIKRQRQKRNLSATLEKARRENVSELDLSYQELTEIPAELFQLKNLTGYQTGDRSHQRKSLVSGQ